MIVAFVASVRRVRFGVANHAVDLPFPAVIYGESVLLQPSRYPAADRVTDRAVRSKRAVVYRRVFVARDTTGFDPPQIGLLVTVAALQIAVPKLKREARMVERLELAMARKTISTVLGDVLIGVRRVDFSVTAFTRRLIKGVSHRIRFVAIVAGKRLTVVGPGFMLDQVVSSLIVRERGHRGHALVSLRSPVFDMAEPAVSAVLEHAMNAFAGMALVGDVAVAVLA